MQTITGHFGVLTDMRICSLNEKMVVLTDIKIILWNKIVWYYSVLFIAVVHPADRACNTELMASLGQENVIA